MNSGGRLLGHLHHMLWFHHGKDHPKGASKEQRSLQWRVRNGRGARWLISMRQNIRCNKSSVSLEIGYRMWIAGTRVQKICLLPMNLRSATARYRIRSSVKAQARNTTKSLTTWSRVLLSYLLLRSEFEIDSNDLTPRFGLTKPASIEGLWSVRSTVRLNWFQSRKGTRQSFLLTTCTTWKNRLFRRSENHHALQHERLVHMLDIP